MSAPTTSRCLKNVTRVSVTNFAVPYRGKWFLRVKTSKNRKGTMLFHQNSPLQSVVYATDSFPEGDAFRLISPTFPLLRESPRKVEPFVWRIIIYAPYGWMFRLRSTWRCRAATPWCFDCACRLRSTWRNFVGDGAHDVPRLTNNNCFVKRL